MLSEAAKVVFRIGCANTYIWVFSEKKAPSIGRGFVVDGVAAIPYQAMP
ncbi:hypothetical protein [Pontibacter sp. BAB1700]|nr:hypothetical protein [Pontibacter sp. BAB1700]